MTDNQVAKTVVSRYAWAILFVVCLANVVTFANQIKVAPMLPALMQTFSMDLTTAGLLMSVIGITGLVLALPAGFIVVRIGAKVAGLVALGCILVGTALGAVSSTAGVLLAGRALEGIGAALIGVVLPVLIALSFPVEKRGLPMGMSMSAVPLGYALIFNLAPSIDAVGGWQAVWWFGAAAALVTAILFAVIVRVPQVDAAPVESSANTGKQNGLNQVMSDRNIWLLGFAITCFGVFNIVSTFMPTFLTSVRNYPLAEASFISSVGMIVAIFAGLIGGWVLDRVGSRKLVYTVCFLIISATMLFLFTVTGWLVPALLVVQGLVATAIPTAVLVAVPEVIKKPALVGIGMGVATMGWSLGIILGPILIGTAVGMAGWAIAGYLVAGICLVGAISGWFARVR